MNLIPIIQKTAVKITDEIIKEIMLHSMLSGSFEHIPIENNE